MEPSVGISRELRLPAPLNSLAWSPAGDRLAVLLTHGVCRLYSWPDLQGVLETKATAMAWHPSRGLTIAVDGRVHLVGAPPRRLAAGAFTALRWSPDGRWLGLVGERGTRVLPSTLDAVGGKRWDFVKNGPFAFGPDNLLARAELSALTVTHLTSSKVVSTTMYGAIERLFWCADGERMVVGTPRAIRLVGVRREQDGDVTLQSSEDIIPPANTFALDPAGEHIGVARGRELQLLALSNTHKALFESFPAEQPVFDVQCHPTQPIWAWACGSMVAFTEWPTTAPQDALADTHAEEQPSVMPPPPRYERLEAWTRSSEEPVPLRIEARELPVLAHHLVLSGHARPDLLQDFSLPALREALDRAKPRDRLLAEALPALLDSAKTAPHQPHPWWLGWVTTVRAAELESLAKRLRETK